MVRPVLSRRGGDGGDGAVAAVTENGAAGVERVREGVAGNDDVVAVAGPAVADGNDVAPISANDDLGLMLRR